MSTETVQPKVAEHHLVELLTRTQRQWLMAMEGPDAPDGETGRLRMSVIVAQFTAAWFLLKLIQVDPAEAEEATQHLRAILADGGDIGGFTWDMLAARGIDPSTIQPAPETKPEAAKEI